MENKEKHILLVDESWVYLSIGKKVLEVKYIIATASSAEKMFCFLENNTPDMILLDVDMPEMNGYEAIKILKSKPETKDIPVIFLTARTGSDDKLEGLSLGAIDYITKPYNSSALLKRIEINLC
ncbi:MAG: response regulator [Treponema sp.]|jgi:DNA-binding response OmpR family regulator|nr:response regulator [Treponema sp.]